MGTIGRAGKYIFGQTIGRMRYCNNGLWVFGEWLGKRCCDNSLFFANYIAENHPEIPCVWISKKETDLSLLDERVRRIEQGSEESGRILRDAAYIIVNQYTADVASDDGFDLAGPVVVNLWHGVPWKKIGYEAYKKNDPWIKAWLYYRMLRRSTTYWLSLNPDFTEIFKKGYGAKDESILRAGYPRNSEFYDSEKVRQRRNKLLDFLGIADRFGGDAKILTYMPTFRDHKEQPFSFDSIAKDAELQKTLKDYNVVILQKAHFAEREKGSGKDDGRIITVNDYPAAPLLAATDLLITDYSSCFFDYLLLDRPIIHYLYDYEYYRTKDRGLYYTKEEAACGDMPENVSELLKSIVVNLENPGKDAELRKRRRERFMAYESADSCEKIFRAITEGRL